MKIYQVEELVGITKKNIRFYEEEGLLNPERDPLNGYRDYTLKDVQQLKKIKSRSESFLRSKGYGYPVEVSVTRTGFNTRVYDDFTLPAGEYDALRVVIGSGQGRNWWCVLYPAMCFSSSGSFDGVISDGEQELVSGGEKYEVKFRIVEIFESLFSFFR